MKKGRRRGETPGKKGGNTPGKKSIGQRHGEKGTMVALCVKRLAVDCTRSEGGRREKVRKL